MGRSKAKGMEAPSLSGPLAAMNRQARYDLKRAASGQGPSVAKEQLKEAQNRTFASQIAAAQISPTRNVSGLQRQLRQEQGMGNREVAQAGAIGQTMEQLSARDAILGVADSEMNRQAQLQQIEAQRRAANAASANQTTGALVGAASTLLVASDKSMKKDIKPADKKVKSFLDAISESKNSQSTKKEY